MTDISISESSFLKLHLEPDGPIEVGELTAALGSLARQYQVFVVREGLVGKTADARLLVSSVSPGSIDINFIPDLLYPTVPLLVPLAIERYELLEKFARHVKRLLDLFLGDSKTASPEIANRRSRISVTCCSTPMNSCI